MKYIAGIFSLLLTTIAIAQSGYEGCSRIKQHNHFERSNILSIADIAKTELYDVHHYFLDLNMTNLNTSVDGTVEIHAKTRDVMDEFVFELHSNFNITDIQINGVFSPHTRLTSGVYVPVNMQADSSFICSITYNGTAPDQATNPLGGGGLTSDSSPSWGNQVTWTLSEPFSAFEWFPCKQSLKDKIDSTRFHVTIDNALKAGSNGLLVNDVDLGNGSHRMEWKSNYPIDYYLISVSIGEYIDYSYDVTPAGASDPILIQNYIYNNPATLTNFQDDIDETGDFMTLFSEKFGLYPFHSEKYGHCMAPLSGGMEHQTMTTQGFFEKTLTAHELAHQWFGDYVTAGSWSDLWLNEGFATYSEYIMLENLYPGQEVNDMQNTHNSVMSDPAGSVWIEDSLNSARLFNGRLTYNKGAAIIHTLRYLINDDVVFFNVLKTHLQNQAFSTSSADEFFNTAEGLSGLDLTNFKNEWYYGEGFPTYNGTWNQIGAQFYLNLDQTTSASGTTPLFTNDVDVTLIRSGASDTIIRVQVDNQSEFLELSISGTVTDIEIDDENWIVNEDGTIEHDPSFTSINEYALANFHIYPNPANNILQVESDLTIEKINIYNNSGQQVKSITTSFNMNSIDITELSSGMYIIELVNNEGVYRKQFAKQ